MSDVRLRELERRWRESGALADEAVWLVERVRAGTLAQERLELLAHCGGSAALLALGRAAAPPPRTPNELSTWVITLIQFGRPTMQLVAATAAAACAAAALEGVPEDAAWGGFRDRVEVREALAALEAWRACPCDAHLAAVARIDRPAQALLLQLQEAEESLPMSDIEFMRPRQRHLSAVWAIAKAVELLRWPRSELTLANGAVYEAKDVVGVEPLFRQLTATFLER